MNNKTALKIGKRYLVTLKDNVWESEYPKLHEVTIEELSKRAIKFAFSGGSKLWMTAEEFYERYEVYEVLTTGAENE